MLVCYIRTYVLSKYLKNLKNSLVVQFNLKQFYYYNED